MTTAAYQQKQAHEINSHRAYNPELPTYPMCNDPKMLPPPPPPVIQGFANRINEGWIVSVLLGLTAIVLGIKMLRPVKGR